MNLTDKQKDLLNRRRVIALSTASKTAEPQGAFVYVNSISDDEVVFTDCQMTTTRKNLLENPKVVLMAFEEDYGYCLKLFGDAEYLTEGERFEFVKGLEDNKEYSVNGVVVVKIEGVIEFS